MEKLFEKLTEEHALFVLLSLLVAFLAIHLLWKVAEKQIDDHKEKAKELDDKLDRFSNVLSSYMADIIQITDKMTSIEQKMNELIEVETKILRLNRVVKTMAGDRWEAIKKSVDEDL